MAYMQMTLVGVAGTPPGGGGYSFVNTEAATLCAAMTATIDDTFRGVIDAFYSSVKAGALSGSNILAKCDAIFGPGVGLNTADCVLNWVTPGSAPATLVGTPTFTAGKGVTGNGTSSYINSNFNPATATLFAQNSGHVGAYVRTNFQSGSTSFGASQTTGTACAVSVLLRNASNNIVTRMNDATLSNNSGGTTTTSAGFTCLNRLSSATKPLYKNGTLVAAPGVTSLGRPNLPLFFGAVNNDGVAAGFTAHEWSFLTMGAGLSANENADLANAVAALATAFGW